MPRQVDPVPQVRLHERHLLDEVRQIVRDGVQAAHPWLRYPPSPADAEPAVRQVPRPPIPFARVQQLLRDLLGQQDLRHIRGLTIDRGAVEVEVLALNEHGRPFVRGHDEIAIDRICIPVSR